MCCIMDVSCSRIIKHIPGRHILRFAIAQKLFLPAIFFKFPAREKLLPGHTYNLLLVFCSLLTQFQFDVAADGPAR